VWVLDVVEQYLVLVAEVLTGVGDLSHYDLDGGSVLEVPTEVLLERHLPRLSHCSVTCRRQNVILQSPKPSDGFRLLVVIVTELGGVVEVQ
jgi:hypothetical protein